MYRIWLAAIEENTPENRAEILSMAADYCATSEARNVTPDQILEWFQGYSAGNVSTPQVFIAWHDSKPIGFVITEQVEVDGKLGIQICHGYLRRVYNHTTLSYQFLEVVEQLAKKSGFSFVSCITHLDPQVYARWIRRAGYSVDYTAFVKEF